VGKLRRVLAEGVEPLLTRSELERLFLELCRDADLPVPSVNAVVLGYEVDAVWPHRKLVVELDGYGFHRSRAAFERDRARDAALQVAGYRVLRVTDRRLAGEAAAVQADVRSLLGLGRLSYAAR
jgi:very-short-patch-repair endonuclease